MASPEKIYYFDDEDLSSASTSSVSVLCAPRQNLNSSQHARGQPQQGKSTRGDLGTKATSVVSVVTNTAEGERVMRATLNFQPNLGDNSDAESVVDNSLACANDVPLVSDNKILNNLDKETTVKLTDENKYFIPHIPDLFCSEKDCKSTASDCGQTASSNISEPVETPFLLQHDGGVTSGKSFGGSSHRFPIVENMSASRPRDSFDGNGSLRGENSRNLLRGTPLENKSHNVSAGRARPRTEGTPQTDLLPPMSRSDSISSLASEVSSCAGEAGTRRRRSSGLSLTDEGGTTTRLRSSKRRKSSLKPRFKSTFADATLQYIKDRLEGRMFSGWLEERQRLDNVVKLPSNLGGAVEGEMWRDVVEVDACEVEMVTQLDAVLGSVPGVRDGRKWINIQPPGAVQGYLLWLVLEGEPRPPQHYWFRVLRVSSHPLTGLQLHVSIVRSVGESDAESPTARNRRLAAAAAAAAGDVPLSLSLAGQQLADTVKRNFTGEVLGQYAALALQPSNVAYAIRMVVFAVVSVVVGGLHCIRESARLFLLFMREAGWLIDRVTPAFQILVNFVEKIIGGFFVLLAMVYKDVRRPNNYQPPPPRPSIAPSFSPSLPAIQPRRFVPRRAWRECDHDT
ncbi:hypothetical protein FHG87_015221 [Trinorchestia longiramus]|nr:hypothetical protein FHG87_015221 [Trinorchestia longiramus]